MKLEYDTYVEVLEGFSWDEAWDYVHGTPKDVNAANECLDRHPDERTALSIARDDGSRHRHTFGELSDTAAQFAQYLSDRGFDAGDRVAIMLNPSFEFVAAFFGAMKAGAVAVPCSELFGPEALQYRIDAAEPSVLVTSSTVVEDVDTDGVGAVLDRDEFTSTISEYTTEYRSTMSETHAAWLQFTSGTTGTPTDVPFTHGDVVRFAPVMDLVMAFDETDVCFSTSSTGWGTGIWIALFAPLTMGVQTGYYSGKFDPELVLEAIDAFNVNTMLGIVPTAYRRLIDVARDESPTVEKANYVGEPIDSDLSRAVEATFGAFPRSTYGATEIRSIITIDYGFPDYEFRHGSMGKPLPGQEVTVLDDDGKELPPGEVGTLALRRKADWIETSDAGYRDGDGYFWSAGRVDDTIISAGYTIGPQEVEDSIRAHEGVQEVGVVGVPDDERGEIVKAFVTPVGDPAPGFVEELQSYVREHLSKHEYPREIELVAEVPTTPDGKIQRSLLREREEPQ
jgi:acetyl-CoA synthetase